MVTTVHLQPYPRRCSKHNDKLPTHYAYATKGQQEYLCDPPYARKR